MEPSRTRQELPDSSTGLGVENFENGSPKDNRPGFKHDHDGERVENEMLGDELEDFRESAALSGYPNRQSRSKRGERWKWWKMYTLHFLFMWNTRTYEYASVS
jgi:hypothetical protein